MIEILCPIATGGKVKFTGRFTDGHTGRDTDVLRGPGKAVPKNVSKL